MTLKIAALAFGAIIAMQGAVQAATYNFTKDYEKSAGEAGEPIRGEHWTMHEDYVKIHDTFILNRFYDELSFGDHVTGTIDSIQLTLNYSNAHNQMIGFGPWAEPESWAVYGSDGRPWPVGSTELGQLSAPNQLTITLDNSLTDARLISVFDHAKTTGTLGFWFGANGWLEANFNLHSAQLVVTSSLAAVPVPAAGVLLLGALGGLGLLRRRKAVAA